MKTSSYLLIAVVLLLGRTTNGECFGDIAVGTTTWSSDTEYFSVVFATITNTGDDLIKVPYDVTIYNPVYKSVDVFWNFNVTLFSEGTVIGMVSEDWADLLPLAANSVNFGFVVGHDLIPDLNQTVPIELKVADETCSLETFVV